MSVVPDLDYCDEVDAPAYTSRPLSLGAEGSSMYTKSTGFR